MSAVLVHKDIPSNFYCQDQRNAAEIILLTSWLIYFKTAASGPRRLHCNIHKIHVLFFIEYMLWTYNCFFLNLKIYKCKYKCHSLRTMKSLC